MPFYQLLCEDCETAFEKRASIGERAGGHIVCPSCGSKRIQTDYSSGSANVQVKKENGGDCPHRSVCGCGGACGGH